MLSGSPLPTVSRSPPRLRDRGQQRTSQYVVSSYRVVAVLVGNGYIVAGLLGYSLISPTILLIGVTAYSVVMAAAHLRWKFKGLLGSALLGLDVAVCFSLVVITGGLHSPFLLYSLVPVLTSALFIDHKTTFVVAVLSVASVITGYVLSPFYQVPVPASTLGYFSVYVAAVFLAGLLPYIINSHLRGRIIHEERFRERQRLSREIHDGIAQTLSALRWQTQAFKQRLAQMGIDLAESRELEALAEKAWHESRESLELLRNNNGDGGLLPQLRDYLEHLSRDNHVDFQLHARDDEVHLDPSAQLELLRICQEALTNIKLHARANKVHVAIKAIDGWVRIQIADNGCGFDAMALDRRASGFEGHGINVMQERAYLIGGRCQVLSMPGQGTEVRIEVPTEHL